MSGFLSQNVMSNCDHFSNVVTMALMTEVFMSGGDDLKIGHYA